MDEAINKDRAFLDIPRRDPGYAAGDAALGPSLVVRAIAAGTQTVARVLARFQGG